MWQNRGVAIPTYDQVIEPLLRFLGEQREPIPTRDVYQTLAARLGLTKAEQQQLLPGRQQAVYQNRVGWARDRLKRAGLSSSPRRSLRQLTERGFAYLAAHPSKLSAADLEQPARADPDSRLGPLADVSETTPAEAAGVLHKAIQRPRVDSDYFEES